MALDLSPPAQAEEDRGPSTLWRVCTFILIAEFAERLAYYGMAGSLVLLLQDELRFTNQDADNQVHHPHPAQGGVRR